MNWWETPYGGDDSVLREARPSRNGNQILEKSQLRGLSSIPHHKLPWTLILYRPFRRHPTRSANPESNYRESFSICLPDNSFVKTSQTFADSQFPGLFDLAGIAAQTYISDERNRGQWSFSANAHWPTLFLHYQCWFDCSGGMAHLFWMSAKRSFSRVWPYS
jgi:hypothetical protein